MNDADWLAEVKRWYFAGNGPGASPAAPPAAQPGSGLSDDEPLGYEAAHPALQAAHWPDAGAVSFSETIR